MGCMASRLIRGTPVPETVRQTNSVTGRHLGLRHHDIGSSLQHHSAIEEDQVRRATLEGLAVSTVIIQSMSVRRIVLALCMCLLATSALAQDAYPNRAIKIIAPVGAGSVADLVPRLVAEKLAGQWGVPVYVENRPGGNTNIGAEAAARAEPDGYTLLAAPATTLAVNPSLFPRLTVDLTAFVSVTVLADQPNVLVANPKLPFSTVQGLIAFAKANPGKLTYASPGVGSVQHLSMELLASMTGIALVHVPYKDLPEAVNDVVGGHVDLLFDNLGSAAALIKNGNLKPIAVGSERRNAFLPTCRLSQRRFRDFAPSLGSPSLRHPGLRR